MIIDREMIAAAVRARACIEALAWLRASPRTLDELVRERPDFAVWALQIPGFFELLTGEQVAEVVKTCPEWALVFASAKLTDAQFEDCARSYPYYALRYANARLADATFADYVEAYPDWVLRFADARLTHAQLAACVKADPGAAWMYARHRLTPEQLKYCEGHA